jgi:hypothetical protein
VCLFVCVRERESVCVCVGAFVWVRLCGCVGGCVSLEISLLQIFEGLSR